MVPICSASDGTNRPLENGMRLSFVIPTFNRRLKVLRAIDSIQRQAKAMEAIEIIVIDDGSSDGTEEAIKSEFGRDVRYHKHAANRGVSAARNSGVRCASGEVLVFLDSDDMLAEGACRFIDDFFKEKPGVDILFGAVKTLRGAMLSRTDLLHGSVSYDRLVANWNFGEFLPVCQRNVFEVVQYDESLRNGFEGLTWLRAAKRGLNLYFSDVVLRLYDDTGEDRLCNPENILKNAGMLANGYAKLLQEFGRDLSEISPQAFHQALLRAIFYSRIAPVDAKTSQLLRDTWREGKKIQALDRLKLNIVTHAPPGILIALYRLRAKGSKFSKDSNVAPQMRMVFGEKHPSNLRSLPLRVLHVITTGGMGGAEAMLYKLLSRTDPRQFKSHVVFLSTVGELGPRLRRLGITVSALEMMPGMLSLGDIIRLWRWIREFKPDVVQTWLYHADLLGGLAARLAGVKNVVWGIRSSNLDPSGIKKTTILTRRICAILSGWLPSRIVCNSERGRQIHADLGYASGKMIVIPNGFDLEELKPDPASGQVLREGLKIPRDAPVMGMVVRFDPMKDHQTFVQAAGLLAHRIRSAHFLLCGPGVTWQNHELVGWIRGENLEACCHLLGERHDIAHLNAALDVATLSSAYGEAFPNVIGEAMACGTPCVVTDVGDCALIVGDTGRVVPLRNPAALANAWEELLKMEPEQRRQLGMRARQRIQERYSLDAVVRQYEALFREVVEGHQKGK